MAAAGARVAAENPLREGDAPAAETDGPLFPRIEHPYPCAGCAAFHDDESGFCPECSRRLVPPYTVAMLARAQRKLYLGLLTLIMSVFETGDKAIIAIFALSTTIVVLFWFMTKAVATGDPVWIAAFVLVVVAAILCGPVMRRMIKNIEAVDAISGEFEAAATKLLADRDEAQRGPASFAPPAPPRQPGRELRDIYVRACERRDLFAVEILEAAARAGKQATESSREIRGPNVKHLSRAREKIVLDYGGDASQLRDVLRGSVVCETVDEIDAAVDALRGAKGIEIIQIKNRFRGAATPSGYRDVNVNLVYHGLVVELQVHLAAVLRVADRQHSAYEAARELDLMGALERPDAASLSEIAPLETAVAYNLARLVPALLSLFIAILYLDVFTLKGLRLFVRRADPATWRGFEHPYVVHRVYGVALAAPYLANVYLLARSSGLLGRAARDARRERTRIGLLYEKYFGYEGSHFVWKVFCFQIVEVALQAAGKIPLFNTYLEGEEGGVAFWFVYVFILALLVNVLYPSLLLRSRLVFNQRDLAYSADTFLDIVYALTPFVFMLSGIRSQAMLIPHEPIAYVSNLIPLMHAHFVIATLETAGERERALKRVAPSDSAKDVGDAPNPVDDAKDSGAPEATPPGATPAGRRYRGLVALCLGCWALAMGFFYMHETPLQRLVGRRYTCVWSENELSRRTEWQATNQTRNLTWTRSLMSWAKRSCAVDADCAAAPGCDGGYCDTLRGGFCVIGAPDARCFNKALDQDFGDGGWCNHGKREAFCFSAFDGRFPLKCDVHADCTAVESCNLPDLVGCFGGLCYAGAIDDRCYSSWDQKNRFYWEETTELDFAGEDPSVGDAGSINARCATESDEYGYIDYDDFSAGWCRDGRLDRPCFSPPDSKTSAADFVNSIHVLETVERSDVVEEGEESLCGYSLWLWLKTTRGRSWLPQLGLFLAFFLVCAPFVASLLALPAHAERSLSVWRQTLCLVVICIGFFLFVVCSGSKIIGLGIGPRIIIFFLSVMGYVAAIAIEERVLVSAFVSVVVVLTVHYIVAVGVLVLGSSLVAFAPRSGERSKVKRGAQTKASLAADRGRLPRWACLVYFCVTTAFIALAAAGVLDTDESSSSSCAPCDCRNDELIDCYGEVKTLVWTSNPWNRINSLPEVLNLPNSGIKGIVPGAFENMDQLERLDLGRNQLTELKASTFRGLRRLRKLKLRLNDIHEVEPFAFLGLHHLKELDLSSSSFRQTSTRLVPGCFAGLGKLRELKLGRNNLYPVNYFENGTFEGLDSLKTLDLKGMHTDNGCVDAYGAGLSTAVACFDKYGYERTAPFFALDKRMIYDVALYFCYNHGGEIAVIKSADENERARQACGQSKCWIGLEEVGGDADTPAESQIWRWRGVSEATYVNWHWGQPKNYKWTRNGVNYTMDKRNAIMFCGGDEDTECVGEWRVWMADNDRPIPLCRMY